MEMTTLESMENASVMSTDKVFYHSMFCLFTVLKNLVVFRQ